MIDDTPIHMISAQAFRDLCTETFGLPPPPQGAVMDEYFAWAVASTFLLTCKMKKDPDAGKRIAVEVLLDGSWDCEAEMNPHIERALGRPLTADDYPPRVKAGAAVQAA